MRILLFMLLPIGDTLFATPAVRALRRRYPEARITALVYPTNVGILRNSPDIDNFLFWPTRQEWPGLWGVLSLFWTLRRLRFDLAVEFSNYIWWVTWLSGIPRRTEMDLPAMWWALPWVGREWRRKHAVEHYADAVRKLEIPVEEMALRLEPSDHDKKRAQGWLDRYRVQPNEVLVGIHPGGEGLWGRKRWSTVGFAHVADGLYERLGARVMLLGGKDDARLAADIVASSHAPIVNATGQTTLGETAALAARCSLFIGNDSSPLHMAAAVGTKVVGIYGLTDPRSYHPWVPHGEEGVDYLVVRSRLPCACRFSLVGGTTLIEWVRVLFCPALSAISPDQVIEGAIRLLGEG